MPDRKFNLTVGKLPPFLNDWREAAPRGLIDNFAGFAACSIKGQLEKFWLLRARHLVCQIARANEHVGTPKVVNADGRAYPTPKHNDRQSIGVFCPRCPPKLQAANPHQILPLEAVETILATPGVQFVSIERFLDPTTKARLEDSYDFIHVGDDVSGDMADLAAVQSLTDLTITCDNTSAHVSGCLGKPTWILLSVSLTGAGISAGTTVLGIRR
jgi:hypothetical protein